MTGCFPAPVGRNTSARRTTPSSMVIGASQSTCMRAGLPLRSSILIPPICFLASGVEEAAGRTPDVCSLGTVRRLASSQVAPEPPAGADHNDDQAERQVDGDDLADEVETPAGARPVRGVHRTFERQPRSMEQPEE